MQLLSASAAGQPSVAAVMSLAELIAGRGVNPVLGGSGCCGVHRSGWMLRKQPDVAEKFFPKKPRHGGGQAGFAKMGRS